MNRDNKSDFLCSRTDWFLFLLINTLIAILITLITEYSFWNNLIISHCIGLSVPTLLIIIVRIKKLQEPTLGLYFIAVPVAVIFGLIVAITIISLLGGSIKVDTTDQVIRSIVFSVLIGAIVTGFFFLRHRKLEDQAQLAIQKQQITAAQLKLLQAQIEPHFLFNTLSNVVGLIDHKPDNAREMLELLTTYLRATLIRTREKVATVADEVELLDAYLRIQQIRMGKRLIYQINTTKESLRADLPPMLIQPLVENSISYAIEPALDGGQVSVTFEVFGAVLACTVQDCCKEVPVIPQTGGNGLALENIEQRLITLYGSAANLELENNIGEGMTAKISIPYNRTSSGSLT